MGQSKIAITLRSDRRSSIKNHFQPLLSRAPLQRVSFATVKLTRIFRRLIPSSRSDSDLKTRRRSPSKSTTGHPSSRCVMCTSLALFQKNFTCWPPSILFRLEALLCVGWDSHPSLPSPARPALEARERLLLRAPPLPPLPPAKPSSPPLVSVSSPVEHPPRGCSPKLSTPQMCSK